MDSPLNSNIFTRNYGIDALRIVSIFKIVILHTLGAGGILESSVDLSAHFFLAWFSEIVAYSGVDIFALISGFVGYSDKPKPHNYTHFLRIWLPTVFYQVFLNGLNLCFYYSLQNLFVFLKSFVPICSRQYWYLEGYAGLFICIPLLNAAVRSIDVKYLKTFFILFLLIYSTLETAFGPFKTHGGYSFVWLLLLYLVGAIFKRMEWNKLGKTHTLIILLVLLNLSTVLLYTLAPATHNYFLIDHTSCLIVYTSPITVTSSILYLMIFSRLQFSPLINKIIIFCTPTCWSIYILNLQPVILSLYGQKLAFVTKLHWTILPVFVYTFSLLFVVAGVLVDRIRILLFDGVHSLASFCFHHHRRHFVRNTHVSLADQEMDISPPSDIALQDSTEQQQNDVTEPFQ